MPDPEVITIVNPCYPVFIADPIDEEHSVDFIEVTPEDAAILGPDTEPADVMVFDLNKQVPVHIVRRLCGMHDGCWHEMVATFDPAVETAKPISMKKRG